MRKPFVFAVKSDDQGQAGSERLINLYAERKNGQFQLRSCLGLGEVVTTLPGVVRASLLFDDKLMAVAGGHLVNVLTGTDHGYIGDGFATMASNGAQLAITAGGTYAVWDGTTLSFPSIGNLTGASSVAFARGFMIITDTTGGQFAVSASYDATSINALDFATAEQQPDDVVRVVEHFGEVVLFGRESIEYWPVSGAADFPLSFRGNVLPYGCPNPNTIRKIDGGLVFVGGGGSDDEEDTIGVYRVQAYQPQRVSTHAIEEILSGVDPATLRASIYVDNGHQMYCLHMPDRPAICLDISTGLWHERSSGVEEGPWDALGLFRDGVTRRYLATLSDGSLRALSGRTTEAGSEFLRRAYSQSFRQGGHRFTVVSFDADMKKGEAGGMVRLSLSRDGVTWGNERSRSLGVLGDRTRDIRWNGLGQHTEVSARLSVTDPVDVQIFGTSAEIQIDG